MRRVHFAKTLLDGTAMSITDIAFASGFASVRRFKTVFAKTFRRSPREVREQRATPAGAGLANGLELRLSYREPFDYEALLAFLAARAIPGVESVRDSHYRRTVSIEEDRGVIDVSRKLEAKYLILPRRTARDSRSIRKWRVAT